MKSFFIGLFSFVILGLVMYLWFFSPEPQVITTVETKIDTVYQRDTITEIRYKLKYKTIVDTAWKEKDVDTAAILQAYFDKNYFADTLVNDSALFVEVKDTVTQNKIYSRDFSIIRNYPTITKETVITKTVEMDGLYMGGYIGTDYGVQLQYKYKKNLIGVGGGSGGVFVTYSRKIK